MIAVVLNPRARRLRRDAGLPRRLESVVAGNGTVSLPSGVDALQDWAARTIGDGCRRIAICGGDGSAHQVLTAIDNVGRPDDLEVMLLHGGTMNTVSKSMGHRGRPEDQLAGWVREHRGGPALDRVRRWPLRIDDRHTGFLFGIGIVPRFIEAYESGPEPSPAMAALTLARAVGSAFTGGAFAREFFRGIDARIAGDGEVWPTRSWRIFTIGAVHVIGLEFKPFPGVLTHEARLHAFGSASSPVAFARDLVPLFRGEPARDPAAHDQVCARITIEATEPLRYNLDGDLYDTDGTITVASGPAVRFVLGPGSTPIPVRGSGASSPRRP